MAALPVLVARMPPSAPTVITESIPDGATGTAYSQLLSFAGTSPITITYTGSLPGGSTFVDNGDKTATITVPTTTPVDISIVVTATNAAGSVNLPLVFSIMLATVVIVSPIDLDYVADLTPTITINAVTGADRYHILATTLDDDTFASPTLDTTFIGTTYTFAALPNLATRRIKIQARHDTWGDGQFSNELRIGMQVFLTEQRWLVDDAAPIASPYTNGGSSVDINDTGNKLAVAGGFVDPGNNTSTGENDPRLRATSTHSRVQGRALYIRAKRTIAGAVFASTFGYSKSATPSLSDFGGLEYDNGVMGAASWGGSVQLPILSSGYTADTFDDFHFVELTTGFLIYMNKILLYHDWAKTDATLRWFAGILDATSGKALMGMAPVYELQLDAVQAPTVNVTPAVSGTVYTASADAQVELAITVGGTITGLAGIRVHASASGVDYVQVWKDASGNILIQSFLNNVGQGSPVTLASTVFAISSTYRIVLHALAQSIRVYTHNGSTLTRRGSDFTDSSFFANTYIVPFADATFTGNGGSLGVLVAYDKAEQTALDFFPLSVLAAPWVNPVTKPAGTAGSSTWSLVLDAWVNNASKDLSEQNASASDNWSQVGRTLSLAAMPLAVAHEARPDAEDYYAYTKAWMAGVKADWRPDTFPFLLWSPDTIAGSQSDPPDQEVVLGTALFAFWALMAERENDLTERDDWLDIIAQVQTYYVSQGANANSFINNNLAHTRMTTILLFWCLYLMTGDSGYYGTVSYNFNIWMATFPETHAVTGGTAFLWNHQYAQPADDAQPLTYARYTVLLMWLLHYLECPFITTAMLQETARQYDQVCFATYPVMTHLMDGTEKPETPGYSIGRLPNTSYALLAEFEAGIGTVMSSANDSDNLGATQKKSQIPSAFVMIGL